MKYIHFQDKNNPGFFISATDTGIGKTVIAAGIIHLFKKHGFDVGVMKPFQTGVKNPLDPNSDAQILIKTSNCRDKLEQISPYIFKKPLAPLAAGQQEKRKINPDLIRSTYNSLKYKHELMIVEGIGGLLVPIKKDYFIADLIIDLGLPLIIVCSNRLGTINQALLTIEAAKNKGIKIAGIIFNNANPHSDPAGENNPKIIAKLTQIPILGIVPYLKNKNRDDKIKKAAGFLNLAKIKKEKNINFEKKDKKYIWHPFTQMQEWEKEKIIIINQGKGCLIRDTKGEEYLDGMSSYWVNTHGHQNPYINRAISEQLNKIAHSTFLGLSNTTPIQLAEKLVQIAPQGLTRVFYSDNGSTAVETALKMAFQFWQQKSPADKKKIKFISFRNSYHGDTLGAVGVGGIDLFHQIYKPLLHNSIKAPSPYCYRCEFNLNYPRCNLYCAQVSEEIIHKKSDEIAGLIIEPMVQGPGGIIVSPPGYLTRIRNICNKYQILMIADEVATGFGRTGKMFACEYEKIIPDMLCLSKGITGGYLPLAATLVKEEIYQGFLGRYEDFKTFFHGHTYTGNALACAAAIKNIELFYQDNFLKKLSIKTEFLKTELNELKNLANVGEIRQAGFFVGIELIKNKATKTPFHLTTKMGYKVCLQAKERGLLIRPLGNVIVLAPPLCCTEKELRQMVRIIREAILQIFSRR